MKFNRTIFLLLSLLFIPLIIYATSSLEVVYPRIGSTYLNATSTFPHYIVYIYKLFLWISGAIAVLILVASGISLTTSAGNPDKMRRARQGIVAGLVGVAIIFSSFLILYVINPQITKLSLSSIKSPIRLVGRAQDTKTGKTNIVSIPIRASFSTSGLLAIPYGYKDLHPTEICCSSSLPHLEKIYVFPEENFKGDTTTIESFNGCYSLGTSRIIGSAKFVWATTTVNPNRGLEVEYPYVGGFKPSEHSTMPQLIAYWYKLIIWIAGIMAVLITIGGGITYISSTGNPYMMNRARSIIFSGLTGLVIIMGSYLILHIINPQLGAPSSQSLPSLGIWLENPDGSKFVLGNDASEIPLDFNYPKYICFPTSSRALIEKQIKGLFLYSKKNFEGKATSIYPPAGEQCVNIVGLPSVKSIKVWWDLPGVYIWAENDSEYEVPFLIRSTNADISNVLGDFYDHRWTEVQVENSTDTAYTVIFYIDKSFKSDSSSFVQKYYDDGEKKWKKEYDVPYKAGGWIYPGPKGPLGKQIAPMTFPFGDYFLHKDDYKNHIYGNGIANSPFRFQPHIGSIQIFDKDKPDSYVRAWLYRMVNYMEKDEHGNDLKCPGFCPINYPIYYPKDLSPYRFSTNPFLKPSVKRGCKRDVESLKTIGLTILIEPAEEPDKEHPDPFAVGSYALPFRKAQAFYYEDPDLSKDYIGRCGSNYWHYNMLRAPQSCAEFMMLLPLKH